MQIKQYATSLAWILAAAPAFAETLSFNDFSAPTGIALAGNALFTNNRLRLTPALENQVGAAWIDHSIDVRDGFDVRFQFQVTNKGGWKPDWSLDPASDGADGLALVIQGVDAKQIGAYASGIGYMYLPNSLAIEFDMWQNIPAYCEPNGNHIAVQSLGLLPNRAEHCAGAGFANPNLGITPVAQDMSNGAVYDARITYAPGLFQIFLADMATPVLQSRVDLGTKLNLIGGSNAFLGFTSSTGGAWENHDLLKLSINTTPEPGTFAMLLLGGAAALFVRRRR